MIGFFTFDYFYKVDLIARTMKLKAKGWLDNGSRVSVLSQ